MAEFFDTHAHLDYPEYEKDFSEVIARAQTAGIVKMISIGTSLASSVRAVQLAEKFPAIYVAVRRTPKGAAARPRRSAPGPARTRPASESRGHRRARPASR